MSDYEYVEINSLADLDRFIASATKDELIILKHDIEEARRRLEEEDSSSGGRSLSGRPLTLKKTR